MFGETCRIKLYDPVQECVGFLVLSSEHIKYSKDKYILLKNTRNFWLIHAALVSQKPVTEKLIFLCGQVEMKIIKGNLRMVLLNTNWYLGLL